MRIAFSLCDDTAVLQPALDRASRSLSLWVDRAVTAVINILEQERAALSGDEHVRRLELVNLILGGAPVPVTGVDQSLGYSLSARHQDLRDTLRMFIRQRYNASRTAELLFTRRYTILQRARRAEDRLPVTLDRHGTNVGIALDAMHWLNLQDE